ncbi:FxsA family protein [Shigella flexneri]
MAGLLLVLPGFFTDFLGLLLFCPGAKTSDEETAATFTFFSHAWRWF